MVKNLPAMQEMWVRSLGQEDHLEEGMQATPVFLPGEFHGQRSLVGYRPWDHKESDTTKQLTFSLSFHRYSYIRLFSMFAFISLGYILRSEKGFPGASDSKESVNLPTVGKS